MVREKGRLLQLLVPIALWSPACGAGSKVSLSEVPSQVQVKVSAGAPVTGATVVVYAVSDATGEVDRSVGAAGVLGSAGPTDATGSVTVSLRPYSGPVQVVAAGPAVSYADPTQAPDASGVTSLVQVPASFPMSSYIAQFKPGAGAIVPVTFLTTLADHAALAYARGRHAAHPGRTTITEALSARDPLFVQHMTGASIGWDRSTLRTTVPSELTAGPQTLIDSAYAALFDLGVNQLARNTATLAGYGTGAGGFTAPALVQLLEDDLDADGRFDGLGTGGQPLKTGGSAPVSIDAQLLRYSLALALDAWVRSPAVNKSGLTDADLASAQVFATVESDSSDLFGNAPTLTFDPLDRVPPAIALARAVPSFTNQRKLELAVIATDSSGVSAVHAQVGAAKQDGVQKDGSWVVSVDLPTVGHNSVVVWADDTAQPSPNSGLGLDQPYQLTLDVVFDPTPPFAQYDSAFASYADERTMTVSQGPGGRALVPPTYVLGPKTPVQNGGDFFKAATRLGAGAVLDAGELESSNAANIPVLRFAVPFSPATDAPIVQASFTADVTCPGCGTFPSASGALLPSPMVAPSVTYFDLALTPDLIPALGQLSGPASIAATLQLADAAGNTAVVGGFQFTYHVVGPPLVVFEDGAYASYGDLNSTFPYLLVGTTPGVNTYSTLWDPTSPNFPGGAVRLVRYIITNPAPDPVAVSAAFAQASGGAWRMHESWTRNMIGEPGAHTVNDPYTAVPFTLDGFRFAQMQYWAMPYGTSGAPIPNTETAPYPCGTHTAGWAAHRLGDQLTKYVCSPVHYLDVSSGIYSSADVGAAFFAGAQQGGGEVIVPDHDSTGSKVIVPGAVGATPGTLVLYLTRPVSAPRALGLQWNVLTALNQYETWDYELFWPYYTYSFASRLGSFSYEVFLVMRSGLYLTTASESVEGSLVVETQGLSNRVLTGESATKLSSPISRSISH